MTHISCKHAFCERLTWLSGTFEKTNLYLSKRIQQEVEQPLIFYRNADQDKFNHSHLLALLNCNIFKNYQHSFINTLPDYNRPWDYPKNFGISSWLNRKSKIWFFYFPQYLCFLNLMGQNSDLIAFTSKFQAICKPEWTKEMNFDNFQI